VTYVQEQHIAIFLETRTNELTRLSSQLHTHTHTHTNTHTHKHTHTHTQFATTTMSRLEGGEVRGWPFLYNSLAGLVRMWKIFGKSLNFTRQSGFTSMDQFLRYGRDCFWGLCTLILTLPHVLMLRFPSCSRTCNTMFLRHKSRANI